MRKIMFVCFFACFLLLIAPGITAVGYHGVPSSVSHEVKTTEYTLKVYGGLGIFIRVYGITNETAVRVNVSDFLWSNIREPTIYQNSISLYMSTFTRSLSKFTLDLTISEIPVSLEGYAFLGFTGGIKPLEI